MKHCLMQSEASEVFDSYETLFRTIVKHESQIVRKQMGVVLAVRWCPFLFGQEGNGYPVRMWSAQLPPLARDLLRAHATLFEIGVLQRVDM